MDKKKTKYFAGKVRSVNEDTMTADVVISDESVDRYKEIVRVESFKNTKKEFMKHPVLLSSHAYCGLMNQIGMFEKLTIDSVEKEVVGKIKYFVGLGNAEADWAWVLAQKGIAAFSVGFLPKKWTEYGEEERLKSGAYGEYTDIELLEVSQVLIPANPSALQKSFEGESEEATDVDELVKRLYDAHKDFFVEEDEVDGKMSGMEEKQESEEDPEIETRKWEETEKEIRHRVREPEQFDKFRYMKLKKDKPRVNAVYGHYKDKDEWAIQALRFPKEDDWTIESAKAWVKEHPDVVKVFEDVDVIFMMAEEDSDCEWDKVDVSKEQAQIDWLQANMELLMRLVTDLGEKIKVLEGVKTEEKEVEKETEEIDNSEEIKETPTDVLGDVKMDELLEEFKKMLHREDPSMEEVSKLFENMNNDIKARFSAQS